MVHLFLKNNSMNEHYKYIYTKFSFFGSLPTYKVFLNEQNKIVKWVFADNSFIYGYISDWALNHSGLDVGKATWAEESTLLLNNEKFKLNLYRSLHQKFKTELSE